MIIRGGSNGGFIAFVARNIDDKNSIVLLNNTGSSKLEEIIDKITAILYDRPYQPPKQSLQVSFVKLIRERGMERAIAEIKKLRQDTAKYYLRGSEFLKMGYTYRYWMNDLRSAIIVFELIRDFYPGNFNRYGDNSILKDQFNIYTVLGDTYLAAGQNEKAVECFKKALELNPNDSSAIQALKKLETK
jgi:tetratricopeptide (TPR) repeat protein